MISLITEIGFPEIGGATGILAAVAYGLREFGSWLNNRKTAELAEDQQNVSAASAAVADAATANSVLLRSYEALHTENERMAAVIKRMDQQLLEKDLKIREAQQEIERLADQLATLYERLENMKSS
jgi:predicted RNase H-like nuclease (RuvC/YqgF family)